jgi:RNA-binding protein
MLTPRQRQFLKSLAHPLAPVVRVGRNGVTPAVVEETKKSLLAHELIKVRFDAADAEERKSQAEFLAEEADAQLAGRVGKVAMLYREREEKPKIKLPKN